MYLFLLLIYIINPLIGVLLASLYSLSPNNNIKKNLVFILLLSTIWISLVNMYKVPENDLEWYIESYINANKSDFGTWLLTSGSDMQPISDIGYAIYSWLFSNISGGNTFLFKFFHSAICYLIMGYSYIKLFERFEVSGAIAVTTLLLLLFIPYIFTLSLHLMRQFLAGSILVYTMLELLYYDKIKDFVKHNLLLIILMFTFHKSTLFFVVLMLIPFLGSHYKDAKLKYIILLICIVGYQLVAQHFLSLGALNEDSSLFIAVSRASEDTTFELEPMNFVKISLVITFAVVFSLFANRSNNYHNEIGIMHFSNVIIILSLFVILNLHQTELSNRFYFYLFPFFPFIIVVISLMKYISDSLCAIIIISVIFLWILYIDNGVWTYNIPGNLLMLPIFSYL